MTILSTDDNERLHRQYWQNADYRYYQKPLYVLLEGHEYLTPTDVWYQSDLCLDKLRHAKPQPELEVPRLYHTLLADARRLVLPNGTAVGQGDAAAMQSVRIILALLASRLLDNAGTDRHPRELTESDAVPRAICRLFTDDTRFKRAVSSLMEEESDFLGREIALPDRDLMDDGYEIQTTTPSAEQEAARLYNDVMERTAPIATELGDTWAGWQELWRVLLKDGEMVSLLKQVVPRHNDWGFNKRMVCNVVGIFQQERHVSSLSKLAELLKGKGTSCKSYVLKHSPTGENSENCALTPSQYEKVKKLLHANVMT